jgi:DNA invertase Pin-like site-specific DNA recombinase/translation initiation factor 1 (eIF-1/SUI1)
MIASKSKSKSQLIPAVAYIRCSSDQQVDASIPAQRTSIEKWAKANGYKIIRWYVDEAVSGWKEAREQFQQLITDLPRGDFEAVLCWDQNRFSRFPVLEANHYWYLLDKSGVHLATCNQGRVDWHSIAGWLTASIKQHSDSQHRFQLSADVKRGKRAVAERGVWQGRIPYGYIRSKNGKLAIGDALEVATVQRIFNEYTRGASLRSIAHQLNADGIEAGEGRGWAAGSVRSKLTNPAYVGTFKWNELELQGNHPAIIKGEVFANVQRLLDERQTVTTPKENGGGFMLTGIIKCGKCGSPMCGLRQGHREYYRCQGHNRRGSSFCDLNLVKQPEVVEQVVTAIEGWLTNPKVVQRLRAELHKQVATKTTKANPERLTKQLTTLKAKLTKAARRLMECDSDMLTQVQQGIRDMRAEQARIETALEAARTPQDALTDEQDERIDKAMSAFSTLRKTLAKADAVLKRELLRETVQRVEVWSERQTSGRQSTFRLVRGVVRVRSDNLFGSSD